MRLGLSKKPFDIPLLSIDDMKTNIQLKTSAIIKSRFNNKKQKLDLLIMKTISKAMPSIPLERSNFLISPNIFLADPSFHESAPVDILIGVEFAYSFLCGGQLRIKGYSAILQKNILGWIVVRPVFDKKYTEKIRPTQTVCNFLQNSELPILWELNDVPSASTLFKEKQACDEHFQNHVQHNDSGLYIVKLPFTEQINQRGDSRNTECIRERIR